MDNFELYKQDFDNWVDKWEKALEGDIFKSSSIPSTSNQTSVNSFFGPINTNPTEEISDKDVQYWSAINAASDGVDTVQRIDEELDYKPYNSPNPVRRGTEGPDQDLSDVALDATFNEEDLKKLEEMKIKLYSLESKIAEMQSESEYASQVKSLIEKIEDLSNKMNGNK